MSISFVPRRAVALTVTTAGVALLAAACGPSSTPSPAASSSAGRSAGASLSTMAPASPPDAAVCADVAALRATAADIIHVKLSASTGTTLTAELNTAKTELDQLASAAHGQWSGQIGGTKSALTALQAALSADANGTGSIIKVIAAVGEVAHQAHLLLSAAGHCPSPSSAS
jgi:hypothetical protein